MHVHCISKLTSTSQKMLLLKGPYIYDLIDSDWTKDLILIINKKKTLTVIWNSNNLLIGLLGDFWTKNKYENHCNEKATEWLYGNLLMWMVGVNNFFLKLQLKCISTN